MNLDMSIVANWFESKIINRMANSIDPDETDCYVTWGIYCFHVVRPSVCHILVF